MKRPTDEQMQAYVDELAEVVLRHANGRTDVALQGLASLAATLLATSGSDAPSTEAWFDLVREQRRQILDLLPALVGGGDA